MKHTKIDINQIYDVVTLAYHNKELELQSSEWATITKVLGTLQGANDKLDISLNQS